jgi:lysophospholipase L1-like esterase
VNTPRQISRATIALAIGCAAVITGCTTTSTSSSPDPASPDVAADVAIEPPAGAEPSGTTETLATDAPNIDSVVMIGDSITDGATPALEARFEALGLGTTIEAVTGKRMAVSSGKNASGASVAEDLHDLDERDPSREVWVVALGTNDIGQYTSPAEIAAAVNEVLAEVPDDAAVVWVDTYIRNRAEQSEAINSIVRERIDRRGNAIVAPWTEFASGDGIVSGDGVHPTADGAEMFAFVVTDTVRAFLGR